MTSKHDIQDESTLLQRLRAGSGKAFECIWERHSGHVYNFVSSMIFDKSSAEDIVQEVFLKVWEKRADIDSGRNFEAWIFTIARNLVYRHTRAMLMNSGFISSSLMSMKDEDKSTLESIDLDFTSEHLNEAISQMPPARRNIYILNKLYGMSIKDIAERQGLSAKTVENQLYQAGLFIRKKMKHFMRVLAFLWIYIRYGGQ